MTLCEMYEKSRCKCVWNTHGDNLWDALSHSSSHRRWDGTWLFHTRSTPAEASLWFWDDLQNKSCRLVTDQADTRSHTAEHMCTYTPLRQSARDAHTWYNGPGKLHWIVQRKKCNYKVLVAKLRRTFVITFLAQPPGERALILEGYYLSLYHARPIKKE